MIQFQQLMEVLLNIKPIPSRMLFCSKNKAYSVLSIYEGETSGEVCVDFKALPKGEAAIEAELESPSITVEELVEFCPPDRYAMANVRLTISTGVALGSAELRHRVRC